jgi:hypothetical protein
VRAAERSLHIFDGAPPLGSRIWYLLRDQVSTLELQRGGGAMSTSVAVCSDDEKKNEVVLDAEKRLIEGEG